MGRPAATQFLVDFHTNRAKVNDAAPAVRATARRGVQRWRVANSTGSTVLRSAVLVAVLAQEAALQEPLEAAEGIRSLIRRSLYRYNVTAGDSLL